jgi:hypothetical protein
VEPEYLNLAVGQTIIFSNGEWSDYGVVTIMRALKPIPDLRELWKEGGKPNFISWLVEHGWAEDLDTREFNLDYDLDSK